MPLDFKTKRAAETHRLCRRCQGAVAETAAPPFAHLCHRLFHRVPTGHGARLLIPNHWLASACKLPAGAHGRLHAAELDLPYLPCNHRDDCGDPRGTNGTWRYFQMPSNVPWPAAAVSIRPAVMLDGHQGDNWARAESNPESLIRGGVRYCKFIALHRRQIGVEPPPFHRSEHGSASFHRLKCASASGLGTASFHRLERGNASFHRWSVPAGLLLRFPELPVSIHRFSWNRLFPSMECDCRTAATTSGIVSFHRWNCP
jgi:hypothetical protein